MSGVKHTVFLFFNDVSKIIVVKHIITAHKAIYNLFGSCIYITNLILYPNPNLMNFKIRKLVYSTAMIPGWLVISLELTEACAQEKHFLPQFLLHNSTVWYSTQNFESSITY